MVDRQPQVLVIGATGRVGRELVPQLLRAGARVRAGTRKPGNAGLPAEVETVRLDLAEPATLERAAAGVDAVFVLWPFFETGEQTRRRVGEVAEILARQAGHVVYLSSVGAETEPDGMFGVVETAIEAAIEAVVGSWTMLRPTGFAGNAQVWADQIRAGDVVRWPFGRLARPLIHERDIAAVAAVTLLDRRHAGERPVITGPERLTQIEQVATIADAIGRQLQWEELDRAQAEELHLPAAMLDAWQAFLSNPEPVTDEVRRITGRPARPFTTWARDHADDFQVPETTPGRRP